MIAFRQLIFDRSYFIFSALSYGNATLPREDTVHKRFRVGRDPSISKSKASPFRTGTSTCTTATATTRRHKT